MSQDSLLDDQQKHRDAVEGGASLAAARHQQFFWRPVCFQLIMAALLKVVTILKFHLRHHWRYPQNAIRFQTVLPSVPSLLAACLVMVIVTAVSPVMTMGKMSCHLEASPWLHSHGYNLSSSSNLETCTMISKSYFFISGTSWDPDLLFCAKFPMTCIWMYCIPTYQIFMLEKTDQSSGLGCRFQI